MTIQAADLLIRSRTEGVRQSEKELKDLTRQSKATENAQVGLERQTNRVNNAFKGGIARVAGYAAGLASVAVIAGGLRGAIQQALPLNAALAETSTLIQGTAEEMDFLERSARSMAQEFGSNATEQVKGFYQAISAGASSVQEAQQTLEVANRLAVGGITDTTTAVNILTSAINVYGKDAISAEEASDALFVAMKAGKTTIGELSSSMGKVLPIAKEMGVSFDETAAITAALTKGGISTAEAVTGLRASLVAVMGPTSQAKEMANALGLEFNTAALESKGFAGFMQDVIDKTGGSADALRVLFGSVEATNAVLALTGEAGESLTQILEDMGEKAGATEEAFRKIDESLSQRLNVQLSIMRDAMITMGNVMLSVIVPVMETATSVSGTLADNAETLGAIIVGLAFTQLPALTASLAAYTSGATVAGTVTSAFTGLLRAARGAVIALGGPVGILWGVLGGVAAAWLLARDNSTEYEDATYYADRAQRELNEALGTFYATAAPEAGAQAINLANSYYDEARAAYAAAAANAELQATRAKALTAPGVSDESNPVAEGIKEQARVAAREAEAKAKELNDARAALVGTLADVHTASAGVGLAGEAGAGRLRDNRPEVLDLQTDIDGIIAGLTDVGDAAGGAASEAQKMKDQYAEVIQGLEDEISLVGASTEARRVHNEVQAAGVDLYSAEGRQIAGLVIELSELERAQQRVDNANRTVESSARSAFTSFVTGASSAKEALGQLAGRLADLAANNAFDMLFGKGGAGRGGLGVVASLFGGGGPSFDGGGDTGNGPRTGGLDGKGGFLAMMHPQETVVDRSKGQKAGGDNQQFTFAPVIDARGADPAALERLEKSIRQLHGEFEQRVHKTMKKAKMHRKDLAWQ